MVFRSRRKAGGERGTGNDVFKIQVPRLRNTDGEAGNPVEGMAMQIMLPCEECRTMAVGKSVEKGTEHLPCLRREIANYGRQHGKTDLPFLLAGQGGECDCRNEEKREVKMRYASVCSGVEAASLAWMPLGWEAVWFSEIEPFPCAVLKERFPDVPNIGDMTKTKGEEYRGGIDLLVGGTPCQGFSVAGKQGGINDPRSALCLSYCRLLETMRPRWFVWENVPGVFSTNGGEDFRAFLRKIDEIGYSCAWRVLDSQYVRVDGYPRAVPQRRRRVFVVGRLGADWRYPASVLFEPGCLPGDTPPRRVKGAGVARSLTASAEGASGKEQHTFIGGDGRPLNALGVDGYNGAVSVQVSATVDTHCKNVNGPTLIMEHYQANGLVMDAEFWNVEDVSTTLTEAFADDRMPDKGKLPCVICRAGFSGGQGENAGGIGYQEEVALTIRSSESGSNQVPDILCQYGDVAGALTARHDSSPCADRGMSIVYENHAQDSRVKPCGECSPQLNAKAGTGGGNLPLVQECFPAAAVRRLLPVECERLMGFPDNHTRIPWRGKPAEDCPDSPRYKACGNSMCVNVMRWIGMRIENVEKTKGL